MSGLEVTTGKAGQLVFPDSNEIIKRGVKGGVNITEGSPITFDSNGFMTLADNTSTIADGLGIAVQDADNTGGSDGAISCQAAVGNTYVLCTMGGTVKTFSLVKLNSSRKLVAHTKPANASGTYSAAETDAARDYYGLTFGRYFGHLKEENAPTNAAADDIGIVRLGI